MVENDSVYQLGSRTAMEPIQGTPHPERFVLMGDAEIGLAGSLWSERVVAAPQGN